MNVVEKTQSHSIYCCLFYKFFDKFEKGPVRFSPVTVAGCEDASLPLDLRHKYIFMSSKSLLSYRYRKHHPAIMLSSSTLN